MYLYRQCVCQTAGLNRESDISALFRKLYTPYVVCGDFNPCNVSWGSTHGDIRGRMLEAIFDKFDLTIPNDAYPAFLRGQTCCGWLDLTVCSRELG